VSNRIARVGRDPTVLQAELVVPERRADESTALRAELGDRRLPRPEEEVSECVL